MPLVLCSEEGGEGIVGEVPGDRVKAPAPGPVTLGKAFSLSEAIKGIALNLTLHPG